MKCVGGQVQAHGLAGASGTARRLGDEHQHALAVGQASPLTSVCAPW
jgi:hypothetical protein